MANCLLYCVRYDDTTLWTHSENPTWRIILVNTKHIPEVQKVHIGGKTCDKLAFIYKKSIPRQQIINTPGSSPNQFTGSPTNQVTVSQYLKKVQFLGTINFFYFRAQWKRWKCESEVEVEPINVHVKSVKVLVWNTKWSDKLI